MRVHAQQYVGNLVDNGGLNALGRLVQDEDFRLRCQSACDGKDLLLATAQAAGKCVGLLAQYREVRQRLLDGNRLSWPQPMAAAAIFSITVSRGKT